MVWLRIWEIWDIHKKQYSYLQRFKFYEIDLYFFALGYVVKKKEKKTFPAIPFVLFPSLVLCLKMYGLKPTLPRHHEASRSDLSFSHTYTRNGPLSPIFFIDSFLLIFYKCKCSETWFYISKLSKSRNKKPTCRRQTSNYINVFFSLL